MRNLSIGYVIGDRGVEMVFPQKKKKNHKKPATQDSRRLRWYKYRFKVERFFSGFLLYYPQK